MMTYRDMTFCEQKDCKHFGACFRSLTDMVNQKAESIGLPVSVFVDRPECFEGDADE